ncbi:hypothetical protein PF005_g21154 [Phytophthora fragariae]|uniref:Uncharacterized protein n=1 Tax=Phytophthora fragariae TaxID=53985 RepID=A0A6A3IZB7_9STRA|nr:hypothetical protein PF003_g3530 [Phytophthora fragariae]KAE8931591.1 hypothetical protein PF009_g18351 [Phytophthora fragariae]KAE8986428.1 hypothetical protein PF011_g19993 [Phytophthora fragariae]KAE9085387.1 hypothetical protein PF010_g20478 [Phytophthora fragariae]KAE9085410.1 hypothetical protein PF007_g21155 [Phytophthora fragariae]
MDRRKVDAALRAMRDRRNILAGGCATAVMAYLPPLLRIEIMRDFFQITGLFFSGMYGPVFEFIRRFRPSSWILVALKWLRNIYNIVALDASELLHYLSDIVAIVGTGFFLGGILLVHGLFIMVVVRYWWTMPRTADTVRHGHEATTWSMLATQNPRAAKLATLFITYCLTVYLPLTQLAYKVLVVTNKGSDGQGVKLTEFVQQFRDGPWWFLFPFEAVLILVTFSLSLPLLLIWSIRKNRPTGSIENEDITYNLDGDPVNFDDKVYTKLISTDPNQLDCPYRSLYAGFERNWSTYKVMQMVAKIVIALIVVSAGQSVEVGGTLISTFYCGVVILSQYSQPFVSPFDDKMEMLSKFTALTTAIGATAVDYAKKNNWLWNPDRVLRFMGFVVVVHGTNLLVMVLATMMGLLGDESFQVRIKQILGRLSFSDTSRGVADAQAKDVIMKWNIENEAKHRVWQSFWRAILLEMATRDENAAEQDETQVRSTERLAQLEDAVIASGLIRIKAHCIGQECRYTAQLRQLARVALEGVDVFWNNPLGARDGHLDSVSCFGKMYIVPYPFHCVVVYDDADDEAVVRDICDENSTADSHMNIAELLSINFTPEILAKREMRQKLRVLSDTATKVNLPFSRTEKVFLWFKFRGWKRMWRWIYRPVFSIPGYYKFECKYTKGVIRVHTSCDPSGIWLRVVTSPAVVNAKQWIANLCAHNLGVSMKQQLQKVIQGKNVQRVKNQVLKLAQMEELDSPAHTTSTKRIMADGFNVTMEYADGQGTVLLGDDGDDQNIIHEIPVIGPRKTVMKADHIGLKPSMEESSKLHEIFDSTRAVWEAGLIKLRKQHQDYRRNLADVHDNQNAALSDGFWFYVYNNARLPRSKLEKYLRVRESNPLLRSLPDTHTEELDALYRQQKWVFRDPRTTCWYVFWDDVYACNSDMKFLDPQDFDPSEPTAICNQEPMNRNDLEEWLRKRNLLGKYRFFNRTLLDLLYAKLDKS